MSNKRVIARKLKQQKKRQKQIAIIVTSVIALATIGAFIIYGINGYNNGTIMTFEGERIDVNDFKYSILASEGAEDVKAMALSVLLEALTLKKHADDEGIVLSEEEITEMDGYVNAFLTQYRQTGIDLSFITADRVTELMSSSYYYEHLLEKYTADYIVDEADYETQLADYKENNKASYYNIEFKTILTETKDAMDELMGKLTADNFDEIAAEYSTTYDEENGVGSYILSSTSGIPEELVNQILELTEPGLRTEPYGLEDGSQILVEIVSYELPVMSEVEAAYRESYELMKKDEIFREVLNEWVANANYTLNQRVYDAA